MRTEPYEAFPKWARGVINLLFREQQSEVVQGISKVRLLGYGSLIMLDRVRNASLFLIDDAKVEPRLRKIGVTLQGFIVGENGLGASPLRVENVAQVVRDCGVRPVDGHGCAVEVLGRRQIARHFGHLRSLK